MRYNSKEFDKAVKYYQSYLLKIKPKSIFLYGEYSKEAFFSAAPFSRAASIIGSDLNVQLLLNGENHKLLFGIWDAYDDMKKSPSSKEALSLKAFIEEAKIEGFEKIFQRPDLIIHAAKEGLTLGSDKLDFQTRWFKPFREEELKETTDSIIKNVYGLKTKEGFAIGFTLVPETLPHPLQDYLDSYAICHNMVSSAKGIVSSMTIRSSTDREGMRDFPEKVSELLMTVTGLELEKEIDMPVFRKYSVLSKLLKLDRLKILQAGFSITGHGYHGMHLFGEKIGYPTKNLKTKWNSPSQMIHKFFWYPQSYQEERPPLSRLSFTSTVPIERLIESASIDYDAMRKRNRAIGALLEKCEKVFVKGDGGCDFEVGLVKKDSTRRKILYSDSDTRHIINLRMLQEEGKEFGMMGNIPGGEAFTTPVYVKGRIVGDVVINIDKSYRLKKPIIAESDEAGYQIIDGPEEIIEAFEKKKKESWNNILEQEKNGSSSKEIIKLKKDNFNKIGEFAINTNPNARLCDYLIVNEKIANMIHVAFGSGFEPDSATEYHMDVVINAKKQKLNIYGIDICGKKQWILRRGKPIL